MIGGGVAVARGIQSYKLVTSVTCVQACLSEVGVTIATGVSQWNDVKAGLHYTQGTGGKQPLFIQPDAAGLNGLPCLRFDGSSSSLVSSLNLSAPGTTPTFLRMIVRQISYTATRRLVGATSDANAMIVLQNATTPQLQQFDGNLVNTNSGAAIGAWVRLECWWNNATSDFLHCGSSSVTGAGAGNSAAGTGREIGSAANSLFSNIDVGGISYFTGKPSAGERALMDSADVAKYGNKVAI